MPTIKPIYIGKNKVNTEQIKLGLKGTSLMALHSARKLHDMVN